MLDSIRDFFVKLLVAVSMLGMLGASAATAQTFPDRPIRFVVPYGPGVSTDIVTRLVATRLAERTGWRVIVDNKPGGRFVIAGKEVLNAPNDGHTIYVIGNSMTVIAKILPFDIEKDFVPVSMLSKLNLALVASPKTGFNTLKDIVAFSKTHPATLSYAGSERGSNNHLAGELLKKSAGIDMQHVPYKDSSYISDLIEGRLQLAIMTLTSVARYLDSGQLKGIAVLGESRDPTYSALATVQELGVSMPSLDAGNGFLVRAGTDPKIIAILNREIAAVLDLPEIKERFKQMGAIAISGTPRQYADKLSSDIALWQKVMTESNIKIE